ncbi:Phosphoribosylglycinamide formyltransferase [Alphaproteobacteria bacterium SO-S41]|nr:Phosphoribosylglycinamide formyltransferase [Alphaproteobacteria bacterium SO-S41]
MSAARKKVAVLISGTGSNLKALIDASADSDCPYVIDHVITNRPDAPGLIYAEGAGLARTVINHKEFASREQFDGILDGFLKSISPDIVALAGFMRILTERFIHEWQGKMTNIHPSLLPAFKGLKPQQQALDAGVAEAGCTVHWVTPGVDEGPIIAQMRVPVIAGDTAETLSARILEKEHKLYHKALKMVARGEAVFPAG